MERDPLKRYLRTPSRRRLAKVVGAYHRFVWETAYRVSGNEDDAADICQEVFLKLLLEPPPPQKVTSSAGFLCWCVIGRSGRIKRSEERRRLRELEHLERLAGKNLVSADLEALRSAIEQLPEDLRGPIELHYLSGLTIHEIAAMFAVSERTVERRLNAGRQRLKRHLVSSFTSIAALTPGLKGYALPPPPGQLLPNLLRVTELGSGLLPAQGSTVSVAAKGAATRTPEAASVFLSATSKSIGVIVSGKKLAVGLGLSVLVFLGGSIIATRLFDQKPTPAVEEDTPAATPVSPELPAVSSSAVGAGEQLDSDNAAVIPDSPAGFRARITDVNRNGVADAVVVALDTAAFRDLAGKSLRRLSGNLSEVGEVFDLRRLVGGVISAAPRTVTAEDGSFEFLRLAAGEYRLSVSHLRFLPSRRTLVQIGADGQALHNIGDIVLEEGENLTGDVVDESGAPIADARVVAVPLDNPEKSRDPALKISQLLVDLSEGIPELDRPSTHTSGDGRFTLGPLDRGLFELTANKPSYVASRTQGFAGSGEDVQLILSRGAAVVGRLVDPRGDVVDGARASLRVAEVANQAASRAALEAEQILALLMPGETVRAATSTTADGRFRLAGVPPGSYHLTVSTDGLPRFESRVELEAGELDLGELTLEGEWSIRGRVVDPAFTPLSGARVWIRDLPKSGIADLDLGSPSALSEVRSGEGGGFELPVPPWRQIKIVAAHDGFSEGSVQLLDLHSPGAVGVDLQVEPGHVLEGTVSDFQSGEPIDGVELRVSSGETRSTVTDSLGTFRLDALSLKDGARQIQWWAWHPDYSGDFGRASLRGGEERTDIEIRLRRAEWIEGVIVNSEGLPVERARVRVTIPGAPEGALLLSTAMVEWPERRYSRGDGTFEIKMSPVLRKAGSPFAHAQSVEVRASHPQLGSGQSGPIPVAPEGEAWPRVDVTLRPLSVVEGTVVDATGSPIAAARVNARPLASEDGAPPVAKVTYTGSDGRYQIGALEAGSWVVEAAANGATAASGELRLNGRLEGVDLVLSDGAPIVGRVVDPAGHPIAGAEVVAHREEPDSPNRELAARMGTAFRPSSGGGTAVLTDTQGRFSLPVAEGTFSIVVRLKGYAPTEGLGVPSGESLADFVLRPLARLTGTVTDSGTADPVGSFKVHLYKKRVAGEARPNGLAGFNDFGFYFAPRDFTDPEGRFLWEELVPGEYRVTVEAAGYAPTEEKVTLIGGDEPELSIALGRGYRLEGIVLDGVSGEPLGGARLMCSARQLGTRAGKLPGSTSRRDGTFSIDGLPEGKVRLLVFRSMYFCDQRNPPRFTLPLAPGTLAEVRLTPAGALRGTVQNLVVEKGESGLLAHYLALKEVGDVRVEAGKEEKPREEWIWIKDSSQGAYERDNIPPGRYQVELRTKDHDPVANFGEVEITAGEVQNRDFIVP